MPPHREREEKKGGMEGGGRERIERKEEVRMVRRRRSGFNSTLKLSKKLLSSFSVEFKF